MESTKSVKYAYMLIDTHAHLADEKLTKDITGVLVRAKKSKIEKIISIGTSIREAEKSIELAEKYGEIFATAGLYPHDPIEESKIPLDKRLLQIRKFVKHPKVVAIGECGLDYAEPPPWKILRNPKDQEKLFRDQIQITRETNLPIIIHSRNATEDTLRILESEYKAKSFNAVWHCFVEDWGVATRLLNMNFMISFTGIITYPSGIKIHETIKNMPIDRLMVETDAPSLTPEPTRSQGIKTNEPAYVKIIAEKIAEIKGISAEVVATATTSNAVDFFKI